LIWALPQNPLGECSQTLCLDLTGLENVRDRKEGRRGVGTKRGKYRYCAGLEIPQNNARYCAAGPARGGGHTVLGGCNV